MKVDLVVQFNNRQKTYKSLNKNSLKIKLRKLKDCYPCRILMAIKSKKKPKQKMKMKMTVIHPMLEQKQIQMMKNILEILMIQNQIKN